MKTTITKVTLTYVLLCETVRRDSNIIEQNNGSECALHILIHILLYPEKQLPVCQMTNFKVSWRT